MQHEYPTGLRRLLIVFSVMLAVLLEMIDTSIVNVALPSIMGNLGAALDEADWIITGYIVSNVIVVPMTGWLAGRFGRTRYFTFSILLFTSASVLCGMSTSITQLVLWRIVQGLGGGALISTSQAILVESFPPQRQGFGQALFGVGAMLGPSLGPTLGGWITDEYSWPWIFFINLPLGLLAAALCATQLRDPEHLRGRKSRAVDWPGIALLVVAVGSLQTLLEQGHRDAWFESRRIVLLTVVASIGAVAFVWRELVAKEPIVDLRVLRHRYLALGCILGGVMGVGLFGCVFLFPLYTQTLLGWSAWDSGIGILPASAATAVMMLFVGRLVWSIGPRIIFVTGMILMLFSLHGMQQWTLSSGWDQILGPQLLRGIGMGAMFVPLSTASLRALPAEEVHKGAGLYNLFRQLGGSFGIALITTLLDQRADVHRGALAGYVGPLAPIASQQLAAIGQAFGRSGLDPASARIAASAVLDARVSAESAMLAFQDAYVALAFLFVLALPLAFGLSRHAPGKLAASRRQALEGTQPAH